MVLYLGADHGGFRIKEAVKRMLAEQGYEVVDCGNTTEDPNDDYVDFAKVVAEHVSRDPGQGRGVLICKSGTGMDITANKFKQVRATLGYSNDQVYSARHDDDVNVLALGAEFLTEEKAKELVSVFIKTPFGDEERYRRRIQKILDIEHA